MAFSQINSIKAFFTFFRYSIVSLLSFVVDIVIFWVLHQLTGGLFFSLIIARIISGAFNFYNNKYLVYQAGSKQAIRKEIIDYCVLAVIIFCFSYLLISFCHYYLGIAVIASKILVDVFLFVINYSIQKYYIFNIKTVVKKEK